MTNNQWFTKSLKLSGRYIFAIINRMEPSVRSKRVPPWMILVVLVDIVITSRIFEETKLDVMTPNKYQLQQLSVSWEQNFLACQFSCQRRHNNDEELGVIKYVFTTDRCECLAAENLFSFLEMPASKTEAYLVRSKSQFIFIRVSLFGVNCQKRKHPWNPFFEI